MVKRNKEWSLRDLYYNGNIFDLNSVIFSTYNQILIRSLSKGKIKKN